MDQKLSSTLLKLCHKELRQFQPGTRKVYLIKCTASVYTVYIRGCKQVENISKGSIRTYTCRLTSIQHFTSKQINLHKDIVQYSILQLHTQMLSPFLRSPAAPGCNYSDPPGGAVPSSSPVVDQSSVSSSLNKKRGPADSCRTIMKEIQRR